MLSNDAFVKIENAFSSGLDTSIFASHEQNEKKIPTGHRYPEEVKRFALTVHFYSPKAYKYLHILFFLFLMEVPYTIGHPPYNVICFFKDVFTELKKKIDADILNADCNLICDGEHQSTSYNKTMGNFEGFVDLGN